jgi:hypothetical protein
MLMIILDNLLSLWLLFVAKQAHRGVITVIVGKIAGGPASFGLCARGGLHW